MVWCGCEGAKINVINAPQDSTADTATVRLLVPAGTFLQGSLTGSGFDLDESPQRSVYLNMYKIDFSEVTNRRYAHFLNTPYGVGHWDNHMQIHFAGGVYTAVAGIEEYPVTYVTYADAVAFAEWSGGRLPSEAEWEKAARGNRDGRFFPWGDQVAAGQANFFRPEGGLWPVGHSSGRSQYGCADQIGNAWEWTADWYAWDYYQNAPATDPTGPVSGSYHVIKGGGFRSAESDARCSERRGVAPGERFDDLGFRCVYDLD